MKLKPVPLPNRITDKWIRERTCTELLWLQDDFQGTCNGERFQAEIKKRKEADQKTEKFIQ